MTMDIDRRSGLSREEFKAKYVAHSRPVILTDAIDHWPARAKWNLDYFETTFPDKVLKFDNRTWRLADFIQSLRGASGDGSTPYLKEVKLDEQFPELWSDIQTIVLAKGSRLGSRYLPQTMRISRGVVAVFIGSKGSGFRKLHWDYSYLHVFISQVFGPKDALLFRADDTPHLYVDPTQDNVSVIPDPYNVDLQTFPRFASAHPTSVTIAEGETLFLPAGWWHATRINEPSIAIAESTLDEFNWTLRKDWYLKTYADAGVSPLKLKAVNAYMKILGWLL